MDEPARPIGHDEQYRADTPTPANDLVPFGRFDRLHVARFVILELKTADDIKVYGLTPHAWRPSLAFLGDWTAIGTHFWNNSPLMCRSRVWRKYFPICEGFSEDQHGFAAMDEKTQHQPQRQLYQLDWPHRQTGARRTGPASKPVRLFAGNRRNHGRENTRAIRQKLLSHVEKEKHAGRLTLTPPEPTPWDWKIKNLLHKVGIPLVAAGPVTGIAGRCALFRLAAADAGALRPRDRHPA